MSTTPRMRSAAHRARSRTCIAALVVLAAACPAQARVGELAESWRWVRFGADSGLPGERISAIVETASGEPWVATDKGLAYFDGWQWHAITAAEGAAATPVSALAATGEGVLCLQDGRILRSVGHRFETVPVVLDGVATAVTSVAPVGEAAGRGIILLGRVGNELRPSKLLLEDGGTVSELPFPGGSSQLLRLRASRTGPWLETDLGLFAYSGARFEHVLAATRCCREVTHVVTNSRGDGLAFIDFPPEQRGMWEWAPGRVPALNPGGGSLILAGLDVDEDGDAFAVFQGGDAWIRSDGSWQRVTLGQAELADVSCIAMRANGDAWVGTSGGLHLFRGSSRRWTSWRHPLPTTRNRVHDFLRARDGSLWIATAAGLEVRRTDGSVEWIAEIEGTPLLDITGVAEDADGNTWIVSGNAFTGAYRWDGRNWRHFGEEEGLACGYVHRMVRDSRGGLWFLSLTRSADHGDPEGGGAFRLADGIFERWDAARGLPAGRIYAMAEGPGGELWFALRAGLARFHDGTWTRWTESDGLRWPRVFTLVVDSTGRPWFGNLSLGLGTIDPDGRVRYLGVADGLIDDAVAQVAIAEDGWLWIATRAGLCAYRDGRWIRIGPRAGLPQAELWPVHVEGRHVIVGTGGAGAAMLDLDADRDARPPRVELSAEVVHVANAPLVRARWRVLPWWGELPPDEYLTRWRVDGSDWSAWSRQREVELRSLPDGPHSVAVEVSGLLGDVMPAAQASVRVPPHPWRNPAVLVPVAILGSIAIWLAAALVLRRRRHLADLRKSEIERLRAERRIQEMQRLESVGLLAGGVAHDFNNLLLAILGHAEIAQQEVPEHGVARESLDVITKAARRAADLTQQLLAHAGKARRDVKAVDLAGLVVEIVDLLRVSIPRSAQIVMDLPGDLPAVAADASQLRQIVMNLVVNAGEALGDEPGRITLAAREDSSDGGRVVELSVADTGRGMGEEVSGRIFEPFFTTKSTGRGLGLAAVHGIVRAHGGAIRVESEPGQGTTFTLTLPVSADDPGRAKSPEPPASRPARGGLALVVDDDDSVRNLATIALERAGYEVVAAADAESALALFRAHEDRVSIAVLDVMMPRRRGDELLADLRAIRPTLPALLMSGFAEDSLRGDGPGFDAPFLAKPFSVKVLVEMVDRLAGRDG